MREQGLVANHRKAEPGQDMSDDRSQPREVSGLSKIEAEDLLDRLEASGHNPCQLSFVDGDGFKVQPNILPTGEDTGLAGDKVGQAGEAVNSQSVTGDGVRAIAPTISSVDSRKNPF